MSLRSPTLKLALLILKVFISVLCLLEGGIPFILFAKEAVLLLLSFKFSILSYQFKPVYFLVHLKDYDVFSEKLLQKVWYARNINEKLDNCSIGFEKSENLRDSRNVMFLTR